MNLDALLRVFYLDVYEFEVYDPFSRPQTRILRGIAVIIREDNTLIQSSSSCFVTSFERLPRLEK